MVHSHKEVIYYHEQGIFLQMSNSVNNQNASVISLFISVLKYYIHHLGSLVSDKYRGKCICNNSFQTRGKMKKHTEVDNWTLAFHFYILLSLQFFFFVFQELYLVLMTHQTGSLKKKKKKSEDISIGLFSLFPYCIV